MRWLSDRTVARLREALGPSAIREGRYELLEPLGRGGMGTVYLARDAKLGRQVALKVLDLPDARGELTARLLREARVLAQLEHPGIVPVHDVDRLEDGRVFYAMKRVRGLRLDRYLEQVPSLGERLRVFGRVCDAVAFAHSRGVLHRDLKPQNVMVAPFGEVLVLDWGVARVLQTAAAREDGWEPGEPGGPGEEPGPAEEVLPPVHTRHGTVLGTPGYMAPEQARGDIDALDPRSDVFSLGALLRFLLTGEPSAGEEDRLSVDRTGETPPPATALPGVPRPLRAIVEKATATDPGERYGSARELAADVERYLDDRPVEAYPESLAVRAGRFLLKHRVAVILLLTYALVRALVVIFLDR